jgi:hypothetical protein
MIDEEKPRQTIRALHDSDSLRLSYLTTSNGPARTLEGNPAPRDVADVRSIVGPGDPKSAREVSRT